MSTSSSKVKIHWGWVFASIIFSAFFLTLMLYTFTMPAKYHFFDFSLTGSIGDTINGVTAPFIGVSVAILTFLAFYMQYNANETHNIQFDTQSVEKKSEKHEKKILYLIKENRNIAINMSIGDDGSRIEGYKCFSRMFNEFRVSYEIVSSFYSSYIKEGRITDNEIINIAYMIFYNGVGDTSNILNHKVLKSAPQISKLLDIFNDTSKYWEEGKELRQQTHELLYGVEYNLKPIENIEYKPFDGHMTRLGQYFRNLFHILSYTFDVENELLSKNDGYELIKSLRSQLSNYEQILIYFNSLSLYGEPLHDNNLIDKYQLIKNIPLPLVDFSGDIHEYYRDIEFEWDEVLKRAERLG